jgi:uncharacterized protein GlcG (DUF336 family)
MAFGWLRNKAAQRRCQFPKEIGFPMTKRGFLIVVLATCAGLQAYAQASTAVAVDEVSACKQLPTHSQLQSALVAARAQSNGGFNLDMWGTIVNRDGVVCAVAFTGANRGSQWPGSRAISAQKANTANAFSLPQLALSTANLYSAVQPGGSLFGLQASNPVDTFVAYRGDPSDYGQWNDPMVGWRIGGVNVFGGGLALYNAKGQLLGAVGVSGDSSCADHNIAWRTRHTLKLDYVPAGVSGDAARPDNIVYDITSPTGFMIGVSANGWGHPVCSSAATTIAGELPAIP